MRNIVDLRDISTCDDAIARSWSLSASGKNRDRSSFLAYRNKDGFGEAVDWSRFAGRRGSSASDRRLVDAGLRKVLPIQATSGEMRSSPRKSGSSRFSESLATRVVSPNPTSAGTSRESDETSLRLNIAASVAGTLRLRLENEKRRKEVY